MRDPSSPPPGHPTNEPRDDGGRDGLDLLMSRLVDGVATEAERSRFADRADAQPELWRELTHRYDDAAALTRAVEAATATANEIEIPASASASRWLALPRRSLLLTVSGWAAVLIVALSWGVLATLRPLAPDTAGTSDAVMVDRGGADLTLTPEEHFDRYLDAPYVLGDLQPVLIEIEELSDGRVAVHFVRRIEEVALVNPDELPVDDQGELIQELSTLRAREPRVGFPN